MDGSSVTPSASGSSLTLPSRAIATSELVVPRSMPRAGLCLTLCERTLLCPGSAILNKAIGGEFSIAQQTVFDRAGFFNETLHELQLEIKALSLLVGAFVELLCECLPQRLETLCGIAAYGFHLWQLAGLGEIFQAIP